MSSNIQSFVVSETGALENFSIRENNFFSDDTSCVNSIVVWNELAKSMNLLISFSGKVHTEKMSWINLIQKVDFCAFPVRVTHQRSDIICISLIILICYVKFSFRSLCKQMESNA